MKNFVQPGDAITITAPEGGCTAGVGVLVGGLFGIAANTVDAGAEVEIATVGVYDMAKTSALAISVGDLVYWDSTNKVVNKTATDQQIVGVATTAAANPSSTVNVRLGLALSIIPAEEGDVITIAAPSGGTTEGVGVKVGSLFGIALATAEEAADVDVRVEGDVTVAKTSALAIAVGDALYWDDTNKEVNKTSSGNTLVGYATTAAANPSDTVTMKLTP